MEKQSSPAKFAFFYLLSLVSLISMSLAVANIIFQIINKNVIDILNEFRNTYSSSALRFAIASILVSAPIYYFSAGAINKSLKNGELKVDSGIRRWLTYLIMLISFLVLSGWFIGLVFNFLEGELSLKFGLKALTAILIATSIFSYYFYDIKRQEVEEKKDKVISSYFYATLLVVIISLISSFVFVESPKTARNMKIDNQVLSRLDNINAGLERYYSNNNNLPETLEIMLEDDSFIRKEKIYNPNDEKIFQYKIIDDRRYEICSWFYLSNQGINSDYSNTYLSERWTHPAGEYCFTKTVSKTNKFSPESVPLREIR